MPNSRSIYAQFLPNKKARPKNGTGFDRRNVVFYGYLILPQRKGSLHRRFYSTAGAFVSSCCTEIVRIFR
nr:MAG TPA: hypothetical protein [Caudoviricetes sp.]